jgi:MFS family permease
MRQTDPAERAGDRPSEASKPSTVAREHLPARVLEPRSSPPDFKPPPRTRRFFLGWTVVAAAAMSAFAQVAFFNPVLGVFIPEFQREFGWSRTEISLAATAGTLAAAFVTPFFGSMIDRYGGRRFVAGGGVIMALGLVCLANMQTEWQFFAIYAAGRGMAAGLLTVAATVTVSKWFVQRRGFAIACTTVGTRLGFATMPFGIQIIIDHSGWRTAAYALAALVAVFGIIPAIKWLHPRPERMGLLPDGVRLERLDGEAGTAPENSAPFPEDNWTRRDAVRTRAFWLLTIAISLQTFAGGAVNLHQIPYMVDRGISHSDAALVLSLFAVFAAGGAFLEGLLDHKLGARVTFILGLLGSSAGMVVLMFTTTFLMGIAFAASYGVAFGLMLTSQQVVFADYFGREALGAIRAASLPLYMTLQALGPVVGGVAYDLTGSYISAFILFTAGYLVAAAALLAAHRPQKPEHRRELLVAPAAAPQTN